MSRALGRVLSHPLRHRLLFEYLAGPVSPSALARKLAEPVTRVAYHTTVLAKHGYVELAGTESRRGAVVHLYRSTISPKIDGGDWEALPVDVRRALTLGLLQLGIEEIRHATVNGGFDGTETQAARSPLLLDDEGVAAVADLLRSAYAELETIVAACTERHPDTDAPYEIVMLAYERSPGAT